MPLDYIGFVYAATVAAGGIMGYVKAGSVPSLSAGLLFGTILGYGAVQISRDSSNISLSLTTNIVLGSLMGIRYYNTKKFMPAGMVVVISVFMVGRLAYLQYSNLNANPNTNRRLD